MFTTVVILMMVVAILLILVILIQNPKGGGLSSEFGGSTSQMFGVQKTNDILEKLTWGFFAFLIVGGLLSGIFMRTGSGATSTDELNVETSAPAPVPSMPTPGQAAPATIPTEPATPAQ